MKNLALVLFASAVISCAAPAHNSKLENTSLPLENLKDPEPVFLKRSSAGHYYSVSWECSEKEVNEKVVWIECDFYNHGQFFFAERTCVEVFYKTHSNFRIPVIIQSKKICSPVMEPNEAFAAYTGFIKGFRDELNIICGVHLDNCTFNSERVDLY